MDGWDTDPIDHQPVWSFTHGEPLLPGYLAGRRLGTGACRETWLAWSVRRCAPVVIKVARPGGQLRHRWVRAAVAREAQAVGCAPQVAMPRLLADGRMEIVPYLTYEYVAGRTLAALLAEVGPLGVADAVALTVRVACAAQSLHRRGFVHLDLQPDSVLLGEGRVVVVHLGSARRVGCRPRVGRARHAGYAAPELAAGGRAAPSMDVYGLGTIMAAALLGGPPVDVARPVGDRPTVLRFPAGVSADVGCAVTRMLAPAPADRPCVEAVLRILRVIGTGGVQRPTGQAPWLPAARCGSIVTSG
jgi:serine/threonine protein kinase